MRRLLLIALLLILTCTVSSAKDFEVTLQWDANSEPDMAGYNIYRSDALGGPYTIRNLLLIPHPTTTFTDTFSIPDGEIKTYYYVATAVDISQLESDYSNEVNEIFDGNESPNPVNNVTITIQVVIKVDNEGNLSIAMAE